MLVLDPEQTRACLPMADAIESQVAAFSDDVEVPLRLQLGVSLFMPGRVGEHTGVKVVSTVPGNPAGVVMVFDPGGSPLGVVDGPTLTAIRTGAGAGLATGMLIGTLLGHAICDPEEEEIPMAVPPPPPPPPAPPAKKGTMP